MRREAQTPNETRSARGVSDCVDASKGNRDAEEMKLENRKPEDQFCPSTLTAP